MAEKDVKVLITGDASGLFKTLGESSLAMKNMGKEIEGTVAGLKSVFSNLAAPLMAITAVLGGKEFLKSTIDETKNWTVEAQKLARVLGITTEQASVLNLAIGDIYGTQEEYLGAVAKLTKTLNKNEEAFHRLGVETRDHNGRLRDTPTIMAEVNAALMKMKSGTDRNVASAQIYGKSWMEVQRYLRLTPEVMAEAQAKAERLNLIVGSDAVAATEAYRASMNDLEDTLKALKIRIGQDLMPVMTEFNNTMSSEGPQAIGVLGVAVNSLATAFKVVGFLISTVAETIIAILTGVWRMMSGLGEGLVLFIQGDYKAAAAAVKEGAAGIDREVNAGNMLIQKDWENLGLSLNRIWDPSLRPKAKGKDSGGGSGAAPDSKSDQDKEFEKLKAGLEKERFAYEKAGSDRGEYLEYKAAQEAAYWKKALDTGDLSEKTRAKVQQEYYKSARAELKKQHDQSKAEDDSYRERYLAEQKALLDEEEKDAERALAQGKITEQQGLDWKRAIERDKYDLELSGLNDRLAVKGLEPVEISKIHGQIEALEAQHNAKMAELGNQQGLLNRQGSSSGGVMQALDDMLKQSQNKFEQWRTTVTDIFQSVGNAFGTSISGMITGQMRPMEALRSLWAGLGNAVGQAISKIIGEKVKEWMVDKAIAIWKHSDAQQSIAEGGEETVANTAASASGIFKAHSGIPWVGVAIAIAMIALMMATMGSIKGRAVGGLVSGPELTMLGEKGPEIVAPESSFLDYTQAILGAGVSLGANLSGADMQVTGYSRMAAGYAQSSAASSSVASTQAHFSFPNAVILDSSDRGMETLGKMAFAALQTHARRNGQVIEPGQLLGARI